MTVEPLAADSDMDQADSNAMGIIGVAAEYKDSFTYTATSADTIKIYDDLDNTFFIAQADTSGINGVSCIGLMYDLVITAGSTQDMQSDFEIDADGSTQDTLKLIDRVRRPDNAWGAYCDCIVQFKVREMGLSAIAGT
jgi:hypothetical protein